MSAAFQYPHFLHLLRRIVSFIIMSVVLCDAAETAPTNKAAGVAKVAIPPGGSNVRVPRVHVLSMVCLALVWLVAG
jgi:hypothetical protein